MDEIPGLTRKALHRARISRDARFDGKFFIAVTSTGIYCRPICPSPTSKNLNVRYYVNAAAAAAAGFRPCRRCRPEVAPGSSAWIGTSAVVRRALRLIDQGVLNECSVPEFALKLGVSARYLGRLFIKYVGASPIAVAQTRRLHFAKQLLDETDLSITRIAMASGFRSLRRFNDAYREMYQRAPRETRRRKAKKSASANDERICLNLCYRPPYDWGHLAGFLAKRSIPGVERVDARGYARTVRLGRHHATILVSPLQGTNTLQLQVFGAPPGDLMEIASTARRVFDVAADPQVIGEVLKADPELRALVRARPGLRIPGVWDPFECAVRAILAHRDNEMVGRRGAEMLVERCGEVLAHGTDGLTRLFPTVQAIAAVDLAGIGATIRCRTALRAFALAVQKEDIHFLAPADAVIKALAGIAGFTATAAQYVALRALGEPDAFPASDFVSRGGLFGVRPLGSNRGLEARAQAWRPWRSYAAVYLWDAAAQERKSDAVSVVGSKPINSDLSWCAGRPDAAPVELLIQKPVLLGNDARAKLAK